jgi:hypothetical protein
MTRHRLPAHRKGGRSCGKRHLATSTKGKE